MATRATFQGELFARLIERFAGGTTIHTRACAGLVEQVEAGLLDDPETEALLQDCLGPMVERGIDSLVLGCTHYPFLRPAIERVVGPEVVVIDPAPAVARQTARVLTWLGEPHSPGAGGVTFFASGDVASLAASVRRLVGIPGTVLGVTWQEGRVVLRTRA
jgi:glutamate racemase